MPVPALQIKAMVQIYIVYKIYILPNHRAGTNIDVFGVSVAKFY